MFILTHWPEIERWMPAPPLEEFDKLVHGLMYAGWAAMWFWLLTMGGRRVGRQATAWIIVGGAAYAIFDELTQAIVDRQPDLLDFGCDMVGLLISLAILDRWQQRRVASQTRPAAPHSDGS
ncbi:MAG: VanZ family protein [Planctomycetes bacterium]|nr:VanZ family protein [Planctomycetota bacterium]